MADNVIEDVGNVIKMTEVAARLADIAVLTVITVLTVFLKVTVNVNITVAKAVV